MFANLLNTAIGLSLAYVAIFAMPAAVAAPWQVAVAGIAIVGLALIARRSDHSGWQSATNAVLGLVLVALMAAASVTPIATLVIFWVVLWVGLTVSSLALWAALYHPERASRTAPSAAAGPVASDRASTRA